MNHRKTRCRTGCLTCRSRKVKCDEGKPSCERCLAANIECLGYDPKRPANIRRLLRSRSSESADLNVDTPSPRRTCQTVAHAYRPDGLPLVGFPINPNPYQRPHLRARDVLGYNQYLSRTVSVLFPEDDLPFWRDSLCEDAFESEYLFDAIVGLGTLHRAILLKSLDGENDRNRGLDTQVIAVQTYIQALQGLSEEFSEAEQKLDILSGTFLLFAYFECFLGNIPATLRHARAANFYFQQFQSTARGQDPISARPIISSLREFARIYQLVLPQLDLAPLTISTSTYPAGTPSGHSSSSNLLGSILRLSSHDKDVESLIWSPLRVYSSSFSVSRIKAFQETLQTWKAANSNSLPSEESQTIPVSSGNLSWAVIADLPIPPQRPGPTATSTMYLAGAFYNFFMARASWALVVGGENPDMNELLSFAYFYESMRWSFPVFGDLENPDTKPADVRLPCETLASSLVPMLYTIGLCCPLATWLQSVIHHLNRFGQAGLFNGKLLGRCLNTMYLLELHSGADSSSLLVRFPPPTFRVISVLIPDTDGGGFSAFYARPGSTQGSESHGLSRYRPIGQVRWRNCLQKENTKPTNVEFFSESTTLSTPFAEWLGTRQVIHDWRDWFSPVEFDLELATRDHIHGTRFVFDTDNDVC